MHGLPEQEKFRIGPPSPGDDDTLIHWIGKLRGVGYLLSVMNPKKMQQMATPLTLSLGLILEALTVRIRLLIFSVDVIIPFFKEQ